MSYRLHNLALSVRWLPLAQRHVVAAMGFFCMNDRGEEIAKSVDVIARKAGLSVRQVQRIMGKLRDEGVIVRTSDATGHRPAVYRIDLAVLAGAEVSACHPCEGDQGRQDVTPRGDDVVTPGVTLLSPLKDIREESVRPTQDARAREPVQTAMLLGIPNKAPTLAELYGADFALVAEAYGPLEGQALKPAAEAFAHERGPHAPAVLAACLRLDRERWRRQCASEKRDVPFVALVRWLAERRFEPFLAAAMEAAIAAPAGDGHGRAKVMGAAVVSPDMVEAELIRLGGRSVELLAIAGRSSIEKGSPVRWTVPNAHAQQRLTSVFAESLALVFGGDVAITVKANRTERVA